jgi:hypothetical protein
VAKKGKKGFKTGSFKADYLEVEGHTFTRDGRAILRDGVEFIYIDKRPGTSPVEADEAAQLFEYLLNQLS